MMQKVQAAKSAIGNLATILQELIPMETKPTARDHYMRIAQRSLGTLEGMVADMQQAEANEAPAADDTEGQANSAEPT